MAPRGCITATARSRETVSARPRSRRTIATSVLATAIRAVALLVLFDITRVRAVGRAFGHAHPTWIGLVAGAELLTYPAYVLAYRSIVRFDQRDSLALPFVARIVVAGFGPFAISGGFGVDRELLAATNGDERRARVHVYAMGIMEWAVLAPLTCVVSIVFLVSDAHIGGALLWPWVLASIRHEGLSEACWVWFLGAGRRELLGRWLLARCGGGVAAGGVRRARLRAASARPAAHSSSGCAAR